MPSPQVQQWLNDGTSLRDDLLGQMEKLETQRQELDHLLSERRFELDLLARILDRADNEKSGDDKSQAKEEEGSDDPFHPKFNAKAGSGAKEQPRDTWHAGMS
jgi:hypothetical protein